MAPHSAMLSGPTSGLPLAPWLGRRWADQLCRLALPSEALSGSETGLGMVSVLLVFLWGFLSGQMWESVLDCGWVIEWADWPCIGYDTA